MKRDMDLIRQILLAVQAKSDLQARRIEIKEVDELVLARHVELLGKEGFFEGSHYKCLSDSCEEWKVKDLSWDGHEFIGAIAKDELWQKLKSSLGPAELSAMSLKAIKDAAIAGATAYLKSKLGLG